jgi:uncharacterized protein (DUF1778 family)
VASASKSKTERLDLRLPADTKRLIEHAAALSGQTVSTFVLGLIVPTARRAVQDSEVIKLSSRDRDRVTAALDKADAKPNAALKRAARRYQALIG